MSGLNARVCAMLVSVSVGSLLVMLPADAQSTFPSATGEQSANSKPVKRKRAAERVQVVSRAEAQALLNARAQAGPRAASNQTLDEITVAASKTEERAIDALAPVSIVTLEEIQKRQASKIGDLIYNLPGVWLQDRGDEPSTSINIRGLQDFGRVAVVVDGARQNYQRTGHFANGSFFLNPELVGGIDIVRGPTANIYGSGAIGGVASFRTKDVQDVVRLGERWGVDTNTVFGTNSGRALGSVFGGVHVNPNVDIFAGGTYSTQNNYKDGTNFEVANTANRLSAGIAKITVRPADGHEVKLGHVFQEDIFSIGQPARRAGDPNSTNPNGTNNLGGTSVYRSDVKNYTTTLGWKYSEPGNNLFDWDSKVYWNRTDNDQVKIAHNSGGAVGNCAGTGRPGNSITGCVGDARGYRIDTIGFDVYNTSRFNAGDVRNALTYGVDGFRDEVSGFDKSGNSNKTTPSGERTVGGGFIQWKANYTSLFEMVTAIRYDNYKLESAIGGSKGDRFSPKITIGLMPAAVLTPYVSYAEGYRSPTITETLVSGAHAATGPGMGGNSVCPDGSTGFFCFIANPNLRPEVGKNKEAGLNLKKDNLFAIGDSFRGKFNVFQNDVQDFIDAVVFVCPAPMLSCFQYRNIAAAKIRGFEAETLYDAGTWFAGVSGSIQEGRNVQTNIGLYSIPSRKITTSAGLRFFENRLVVSALWTSVKGNTDIPANYLPATSYDLVNLYLTARPTKDMSLQFSAENLLNVYYRPYAVPGVDPNPGGGTQNDVKWASAGAGITFKGGLRYHFGGN